MKHNERLVKGSFYLMLDNVSNSILGALFWIVMAKLVEPSTLGQVMVVIALATAIIGFTGSGSRIMNSKYISEFNAQGKKHLARHVLILGIRLALLVSGIAAVAIIILANNIAGNVYNSIEIAPFLIFSAIGFIPSQTLQIALQGAFEGAQKMRYSLFITLLFQSIRLVSAVVLIAYGLSAFGVIAGFAAGTSTAALIGYFYLTPKVLPKIKGKKEDLRHAIQFSGLNYANAGMRALVSQIGVIVLGTQSFELAAFYGIAAIISRVIEGSTLAISRTVLPTASGEYAKGSKDNIKNLFNTSVRMSLVISGFILVIFISNPSYILNLLAKSYTTAAVALNLLIIAAFMNALSRLATSILNASGNALDVARIGLVTSLTTIILTIVLVFILSIEGAAIAMLVGSLLALLLSAIILWKKEGIILSIKDVSRPITTILSTIFATYALSTLFSIHILLTFVIAALLYISFSFVYKATTTKEILSFIGILTKKL